jgi:hypothetical protein
MLACGQSDEGAAWLWTIERSAPSFRDGLDALAARGDEERLARGLAEYASAAAITAAVGIEQGLRLDASLLRFAVHGEGMVHTGEIADQPAESLARALVEPLSRYAGHDSALAAYLQALTTALVQRGHALENVLAALAKRSDVESVALAKALDAVKPALDTRSGGGIEHERA